MTKKEKFYTLLFYFLIFSASSFSQKKTLEQRVDSVLKLMTLTEKIGQLNQYSSSWVTGPASPEGNKLQEIKDGKVGSLLNVKGVDKTRAMQEVALQSRLKIPLLFGLDVIHGYKTTFPIPLAEAASWDIIAIQTSARIAAVETSASGIHWTFAPMVDISRDPRWGRVMEGAGEDTYLGSVIAKARVQGFQGKGLGNTDAIMACAKHFAAYGAAVGGRDYNSADMSDNMLWETYLPPFKAALDAGVATFMNSFNTLNGIPATANAYLQRNILKGKWNFKGFVVSDWASVSEMIPHGYAKDKKEAALYALKAGSDMDMEGRSYMPNLTGLVEEGKISVTLIDDAVRRVLKKKFELGLFDNPFKFCDSERESKALNNPTHRALARDVAKKSIVLLKNQNNLLPLSKNKTIALIGPLAKSKEDMLGGWNVAWPDYNDVVTQFEGLENKVGKNKVLYAKGCEVNDTSKAGFAEAIKIALQADIVIVSVGENKRMTGEAKSKAHLHIPGVQEDLIMELLATGKPIVVLINAGRPLIFNWTANNVPAILYTWWLGSEAGNAIADVLFGDYNPSGKLPVTFPRSEGQIPIYYNHLNTGRPTPEKDSVKRYTTGYLDLQQSPAFPFGFGLSYTTFQYDTVRLSKALLNKGEQLIASIKITNKGNYDGVETVQLYIRDLVASVARPVKELKGFQQVPLKKGESKVVSFVIGEEDLKFYNRQLKFVAEPGDFKVFIGTNSRDVKEASFTLNKH